MGEALILVGGTFEVVGLYFVFAEIAAVRKQEWGIATPAEQLRTWLRRLFRRPRTVTAMAGLSSLGTVETAGRLSVRPGELGADAPTEARLDRLERYVTLLDDDLGNVHTAIDDAERRSVGKARELVEHAQNEASEREQARLEALRPNLHRQKLGALFLFGGIVCATVGSVI